MSPDRHRRAADGDAGFTLVELVIAIVLSGIIAGVITAALTTSLNAADSITEQVADSTDAGLISTYLIRDAQAAGATDPATGRPDPGAGVSTPTTGNDWAGCGQDGVLVVRFSWPDPEQLTTADRVVTTYALDSNHQLTRRQCRNGTTVDLVLGRSITSAVATCTPSALCDASTESVTLTVTGSGVRAPLTYALTASLRNDQQATADPSNSAQVPLLSLGSGAAGQCPNLSVQATGPFAVRGDAMVADCASSPIDGDQEAIRATGAVSVTPSIADPFLGLTPPQATCGDGGENPSPVGASTEPTATVVYPQAVSITGAVEFAPGRYVFCDGLQIGVGATVTGADVLLFVPGGSLTVDRTAAVELAAAETGEFANLLAWIATAQTVALGADTGVDGPAHTSTFDGYVYAPTSKVEIAGVTPSNIGGVVARTIELAATASTRLGLPIETIDIGPATLPDGQSGVAYTATALTAQGGTGPYTWSVAGLPAGLGIDPATGALTGTPTVRGVFDVVVTVLDSSSTASSTAYRLSVNEPLGLDAATELPAGQVAVQYAPTALAATGGTAPFTWATTGLPAGLTIDAASGLVTGTPTAAGSFPVTVTVTDARSATATRSETVTISPRLSVSSTSLPAGQVGVAYPSATLATSGGTPPVTWSAAGLPAGLTLSGAGVLGGRPTAAGTFTVVAVATDGRGAQATADLTLVVQPALEQTGAALPGGQVGLAYPATTLTTAGGTAPFTWSAEGLPAGLALDPSTGTVSGSPTAAGTFTVEVTVVDAAGGVSTVDYALTVNDRLAVGGPATLPRGQAGLAYTTTTFSPSGGTWAYSWSATGLPAGLSLEPATGVLSGTPAAAGSFAVTVTATDALAATATRSYTLVVDPALTITTTSLPGGKAGTAYGPVAVEATGGTSPYTWSASGLPAGLGIASTTGALTGTPTAASTYTVVAQATDAAGATATANLSIVVEPAVPPGCEQTAAGWRGEYYANASLSGTPALCRDDASIAFDWAYAAPASGMPSDNFSVRWTRSQTFAAGTYVFSMGSDDGSRLFIDGALVLDGWSDHAYPTTAPTTERTLTAGAHTIVMEYYERGGYARATLDWDQKVVDPCAPSGTGWRGEYFSNASLTGTPTLCRVDANVDFDWGLGGPATGVPVNSFSARWTRTASFTAGTYEFRMGSDDGSRLYIDGQLVLDQWSDHTYPSTVPTVTRAMTAGNHTIVMEYYERTGTARATLSWVERSNGVTAIASTAGDQRWYGEHAITLTNTATITSMSVTIVVDRTTGLSAYGRWSTLSSNLIQSSQTTSTSSITYTFTLRSGRTISPGTYTFVGQTAGTGTLHPTSDDTWSVTSTANGVTISLNGGF